MQVSVREMRQRFLWYAAQAVRSPTTRRAGICDWRVPVNASRSTSLSALRTSCRGLSNDASPPPFTTAQDTDVSPPPFGASSAVQKPMPAASSNAAVPFSPEEVKAVVFPLIPCVPSTFSPSSPTSAAILPRSISVAELHRQLSKPMRSFIESYSRPATRTADACCKVWCGPRQSDPETMLRTEATAVTSSGMGAYLVDHFPEEIIVFMPTGRVARQEKAAFSNFTADSDAGCKQTHRSNSAGALIDDAPPPSQSSFAPKSSAARNDVTTDSVAAAATAVSLTGVAAQASTLGLTATDDVDAFSRAPVTAPPPPPQPHGPSQRYGGSQVVTTSFFGAAPIGPTSTASPPSLARMHGEGGSTAENSADAAAVPLRTTIQVMDALVEYIPTFYTSLEEIALILPSNIQMLYSDTNLRFFLKRYKHYIDMRTFHRLTEVRLRATFDHPRRGAADARFRPGGGAAGVAENTNQLRRPPRNSEANLIGLIAPRMPKSFTPLADVLQEIAPIVSRHPAFDARLGVTGLLGKYPEYFQVVDGQLRARPYREAPNSLKDFDAESSPLPRVFAKVWACVEEAAAGKNYTEAAEKAAAMVSTGRLYSLLTAHEKTEVKQKCRSFPTFLRLHGRCLVVSADKMRVYKFIPEYEACVDTLLDERLRMNSLDPNDPILQIPAEMAPESNAEWAVRELYDALPLMQCAELDEVLSLVPPAVRDALPKEVSAVKALLEQYDDYFTIWAYPDDENVIVVQRAKVVQPVLDQAEIVRMVVPMIPQGGTTLTSLRTRVPLVLQRYFYRHGTVATLGAMKDVFAISGDRIVRLV